MGYLILNLREALNEYVLEKRQMIVSSPILEMERCIDTTRYLLKFSNDSYALDLLTTLEGTILVEQQR